MLFRSKQRQINRTHRPQEIRKDNLTVFQIIAVSDRIQKILPHQQRIHVLTELQWNRMWFFSLAFFAVIFMEMLSDFLLVTDCCTAWKALNGNVSEAEFHNLQQIVLCENQKVSIEKKLASTILLVLMMCATAAFVWLTFWYKVLL